MNVSFTLIVSHSRFNCTSKIRKVSFTCKIDRGQHRSPGDHIAFDSSQVKTRFKRTYLKYFVTTSSKMNRSPFTQRNTYHQNCTLKRDGKMNSKWREHLHRNILQNISSAEKRAKVVASMWCTSQNSCQCPSVRES